MYYGLIERYKQPNPMANKKPSHKFPPKYAGMGGETIETKPVRLPVYLVARIEAIAQQMHEDEIEARMRQNEQ